MTSPDTLRALRLRVEAASGPCERLNAELLSAVDADLEDGPDPSPGLCPFYTGSVDAALALVRRKLPGWGYVIYHNQERPWVSLIDQRRSWYDGQPCATPALAVIAALLHVLEEQGRSSRQAVEEVGQNDEKPL